MSSPRVLPPDVFDALEFSAEAFGGIGSGQWTEFVEDGRVTVPYCVIGHANTLDRGCSFGPFVTDSLRYVGIGEEENDIAVCGDGFVVADRIPFDEWCRRLNVVRADEPTFDPENFLPRASTAKRRSLLPAKRDRKEKEGSATKRAK